MKSVMFQSFGECLICAVLGMPSISQPVSGLWSMPSWWPPLWSERKKAGIWQWLSHAAAGLREMPGYRPIETASMLNGSVTKSLFLKFQKKFLQFHFLVYKVRFRRLTKHFQISSHPPHSSLSENVFPTAYMKEPLQVLGDGWGAQCPPQ